jgi:hypothetical protein
MAIRPEVVNALNSGRYASVDGSGVNLIDRADGATPQEYAAAAAARLMTRAHAARAIRAALASFLTDSGLTPQDAAGITDKVTFNLEDAPHAKLAKIAGDVPGDAGLKEMRGSYGDGWAEALADEALLPVHQVRAIYGEIAPR